MNVIFNVLEFLLFTVIVKGVIVHALSQYIVKYGKRFIKNHPQFKQIYLEELHKSRQTQ